MTPTALLIDEFSPTNNGGVILSFSGARVDTSGSRWILSADNIANWALFVDVHPIVLNALKTFARHLIATSSPAHVDNQIGFLNRLADNDVRLAASNDLVESGFLTRPTFNLYGSKLVGSISAEHHSNYLGAYIRWYLWCTDAGLSGFDEDVATELNSIRLKASPRSVAVMRQDPESGPLRRSEYEPLEMALRSPQAADLPLPDRVAVWLFLCFGTNPRNLTLLGEEDLVATPLSDETFVHELRIPRIKKRTPGERDQFRTRRLVPEVAELINQLILQNRRLYPVSSTSDSFRALLRGAERKALVGTPFARDRFRVRVDELGAALQRISTAFDLKAHDGSSRQSTVDAW